MMRKILDRMRKLTRRDEQPVPPYNPREDWTTYRDVRQKKRTAQNKARRHD